MDFAIKRIEILAAIDKCSVAAPGGHQNIAFDMMRVEAKGQKKVRFAAVGDRASVDTVGEAKVKAPGSFNVRPKHLRDITSAMPDGEVRFSLKGTRVTVQSATSKRKATFESSTVDIFNIDDPGKDAAWIEVNAVELNRALRIVRPASQTTDDNPVASLLIMTERGVNVFGCNMHLIAVVESSIRVTGPTHIVLPDQACTVLAQMTDSDNDVRIFADANRVYLENCDTLVSAALPANYRFASTHQHLTALLTANERIAGPTINPSLLLQGTKSVLALGGFRNDDERKKGFSIDLSFGPGQASVALALGSADARDEFGCSDDGAEMTCRIDSDYLLKALGALAGTEQVRVYQNQDLFILQTQGLIYGIMQQHRT